MQSILDRDIICSSFLFIICSTVVVSQRRDGTLDLVIQRKILYKMFAQSWGDYILNRYRALQPIIIMFIHGSAANSLSCFQCPNPHGSCLI